MDRTHVTVIIPTLCDSARRAALSRAVESVLSQDGVAVTLVIIVNGTRYDPALLAQLHADPRLRVVYQEAGSLPAALRLGRTQVSSGFFAFLDDDDEYLPGALQTRVAPLLADPQLAVVATNGLRGASAAARYLDNTHAINDDPFAAMIRCNWLASCGGLYRSAAIHADYFDGTTKHFEWTLLAFRILMAGHKTLFVDVPTYRVFDSAGSLSKSLDYQRASVGFLEQLLSMQPPERIRRALRRKLSAAQHDLSSQFLHAKDRSNAWRYHLQSLTGPGAWRYLAYTRRLFF